MHHGTTNPMSINDFLMAVDAAMKGDDRWALRILGTQAITSQRKRLVRCADNAVIEGRAGSALARPLREEYRRIRTETWCSEQS